MTHATERAYWIGAVERELGSKHPAVQRLYAAHAALEYADDYQEARDETWTAEAVREWYAAVKALPADVRKRADRAVESVWDMQVRSY